MAKYEDMRDGFDKDCKEMNMKSATVHSNAFGKTYTFRLKYGHHINRSRDPVIAISLTPLNIKHLS